MIPPVVWIPAAFAAGLLLVLWGGMSYAYERGGRHVREELDADRAARAFRQMPRVPAHIPPLPAAAAAAAELVSWAEHERQALEVANTMPDPHPSGPMPAWSGPRGHYGPLPGARPDPDDTSDFTRGMAAMVAEGMAAVDAYLEGWQP